MASRAASLGIEYEWRALYTQMLRAEQRASRRLLFLLRGMTVHGYTQDQLNAMGNPYSAVNWNPPHEPEELVNSQTGLFKRSWRVNYEHGSLFGSTYGAVADSVFGKGTVDLEDTLLNDAPYADYVLFGTERMGARNQIAFIERAYADPVLSEEVDKGLARWIGTGLAFAESL